MLNQFTGFLFGATASKSYISFADRLVVSGTNFLTLVVIGRVCGVEDLGVFVLAWITLLAVNAVQEAFVFSPFTVFFSRIDAEDSRKSYAGAGLAMQFMLGIAAMILVLLIAAIMTGLDTGLTARIVAWCLLLAIPALSMREFVRRFLFARLAALPVMVLDIVVSVLQLGGFALLWALGWLSPGSALLIMALANGLPALLWLGRNRTSFSRPDLTRLKAEISRHWAFGRWNCGAQISDLGIGHGVAWLIAFMAGTAATGVFAACNSIVLVVNPLLFGIGSVLLPRASEAHHRHGMGEVRRIVRKVTLVLSAAVGVVCLLIAVFGEDLVDLFYALESREHVRQIIILLALANFIGAVSHASDSGLLAIGRPDIKLIGSLAGVLATFAVAILLAFPYGVVGIVVGVLAGTSVTTLVLLIAFSRIAGRARDSEAEPASGGPGR